MEQNKCSQFFNQKNHITLYHDIFALNTATAPTWTATSADVITMILCKNKYFIETSGCFIINIKMLFLYRKL